MEDNILLLSNITNLRKYGTTNFFRALFEYEYVEGAVKVNADGTFLHFKPYSGTVEGDIKEYTTITQFLKDLKGTKGELSRADKIIRAEIQKTDFRSNADPKLFTFEVKTIPVKKFKETFNEKTTIIYDEKSSEDFKILEKRIQAFVADTAVKRF